VTGASVRILPQLRFEINLFVRDGIMRLCPI